MLARRLRVDDPDATSDEPSPAPTAIRVHQNLQITEHGVIPFIDQTRYARESTSSSVQSEEIYEMMSLVAQRGTLSD